MIKIGKVYIEHTQEQARLCANLSLNGNGTTLWFGVKKEYADYLCNERSDAFVMALLPAAMRGGYQIISETPMSKRLYYQITNYLMPTMSDISDRYKKVIIDAPLDSKPIQNKGAVGTGFSGGVDCLYSIMSHGPSSQYPLTHLAVFNVGAFDGDGYRQNFDSACTDSADFATQLGLELICLDSNIVDVLPESFLEVYTFRNLSGAMALQGLFSVYLLSSGHAFSELTFDFSNNSTYDLLMIHSSQTESLAIYSSGGQVRRHQKLIELADWEPAQRWLHPCFRRRLKNRNCGKCKKCIPTMTMLYAYRLLDRFHSVFDIDEYKRSIDHNFGYIIASQHRPLCKEALEILQKQNVHISPEAYKIAERLRANGNDANNTMTEQADALRLIAKQLRKTKQNDKS